MNARWLVLSLSLSLSCAVHPGAARDTTRAPSVADWVPAPARTALTSNPSTLQAALLIDVKAAKFDVKTLLPRFSNAEDWNQLLARASDMDHLQLYLVLGWGLMVIHGASRPPACRGLVERALPSGVSDVPGCFHGVDAFLLPDGTQLLVTGADNTDRIRTAFSQTSSTPPRPSLPDDTVALLALSGSLMQLHSWRAVPPIGMIPRERVRAVVVRWSAEGHAQARVWYADSEAANWAESNMRALGNAKVVRRGLVVEFSLEAEGGAPSRGEGCPPGKVFRVTRGCEP